MSTLYVEPMAKTRQVHTTTDYFLFKPIDGNRQKNKLHLARLKASIEENYLFTAIIVNENYEIIDGQHRFQVIKELGLPLNYIVCEGYGLNEVHALNANSKNWNWDDYLQGYCSLGYKNYLLYRDFKDKYQFGHNECLALLTGRQSNGKDGKDFNNGRLKINSIAEAERIAELIHMVSPYYDGYKRRWFVSAIITLLKRENFEFIEFLNKLKTQPTALQDCTSTASYIALIEEIYNYRRRDKVNLRY